MSMLKNNGGNNNTLSRNPMNLKMQIFEQKIKKIKKQKIKKSYEIFQVFSALLYTLLQNGS